MRSATRIVVFLTLLLTACGGSALSLEEYVEQQKATTDELQELGVRVNTEVETAVNLETGEVVDVEALRGTLTDVASTLSDEFERLSDLEPPSELEEAHNAFVAVSESRLEQWQIAADRAAEIGSLEELIEATLKSPAFTETCMALERAVADAGLQLDLDCE